MMDISRIVDFALGHLPPEEAKKVLEEIEKDPKDSEMLEVILKVIDYFRKTEPSPSSN